MARGDLHLEFNAQVVDNGAGGASLASVGYDRTIAVGVRQVIRLTSFTRAISLAVSLNNKFQALGYDCHFIVWQKVFGAPATAPVRAIEAGAMAEQTLVSGDTPEPGLRERINLANREASSSGVTLGDYGEDVPGAVPANPAG